MVETELLSYINDYESIEIYTILDKVFSLRSASTVLLNSIALGLTLYIFAKGEKNDENHLERWSALAQALLRHLKR